MRLPAITPEQQSREEARQLHEQIYAAFLSGDLYTFVPLAFGEDREQRQHRLSDNYKRFWTERGFTLRTHQTAGGIQVWIEARS